MPRERIPLRLWRWGDGREMTGYRAFTLLFSRLLRLDAYLIYYKDGSYIPPHVDKVLNGVMWRLNIVLWNTGRGGKFIGKAAFNLWGWVILFKPSVDEHSVTKKAGGRRLVLSIGKTIGKRENE